MLNVALRATRPALSCSEAISLLAQPAPLPFVSAKSMSPPRPRSPTDAALENTHRRCDRRCDAGSMGQWFPDIALMTPGCCPRHGLRQATIAHTIASSRHVATMRDLARRNLTSGPCLAQNNPAG